MKNCRSLLILLITPFFFLLITNSFFAQSQSSVTPAPVANKPPASASAADLTSKIDPAQPVITIHGVCDDTAQKSKDSASCSKVITREEFEKLVNALNPTRQTISNHARQTFAQIYAESMALEAAAKNAGLEDTPQFSEIMTWMRLRTVADLYRRNLEEKFRNPPAEEVDAYYKQHLASYDRVKLSRILIPKENPAAQDKADYEKRALEAANSAHERATKGEDLAQIQKETYAALGLQSPPASDLGNYGRANFMEKEAADVFALKPGEVTQVETEPRNYVIYKVNSRETLPEEQVKNEISRAIAEQKFKDAIKAANDSAHTDFSEQYFGPGMGSMPKPVALPATPPAH
jgi:parvulin-like peptidyl-prolyl isomerase